METCLGDRKLGTTAMPPRSMVLMAASGKREREETTVAVYNIIIAVAKMLTVMM